MGNVAAKHLDALIGPGVMLLFPLYASMKAIESPTTVHDQQWLTYWVLYSVITSFELSCWRILVWLPFWPYVKLVTCMWLVLPMFNGAAYIYDRYLLSNSNYGENLKKALMVMSLDARKSVERYIERYGPDSFNRVIKAAEKEAIEGDVVTWEFVKKMMDDFKNQKGLHKRYAYQILLQTREMLRSLPSLVDIDIPHGKHFTVCGDVHGQFYDLLNIFELNGLPSEENPYLFNGDFVDRGSFSLEVILTLFAFKCMSPSAIYLARGNHESKSMNKSYGFEKEVRSKLGGAFVELFAEVFCCLPLAHVLAGKVFVVHGGLFSDDGVKLSDIRSIDRFREPPEEGLMCEILWSDPQPWPGRAPNELRGLGICFGADVTKRFLQDNNLDLVVRSHEVKEEGYEIEHEGKLITVFSAPNYCDVCGNEGAFIRFEAPDLKPNIVTFSAVPHPKLKRMAYANNFLPTNFRLPFCPYVKLVTGKWHCEETREVQPVSPEQLELWREPEESADDDDDDDDDDDAAWTRGNP